MYPSYEYYFTGNAPYGGYDYPHFYQDERLFGQWNPFHGGQYGSPFGPPGVPPGQGQFDGPPGSPFGPPGVPPGQGQFDGPPGPPFGPPGVPPGQGQFDGPPGPPFGPPGEPPGQGQQSGPPTAPPPAYTPQKSQQIGVMAVDPGAIRRCLFRFTYVWLTNRQQFWFYPTFVGRRSVSGYRWNGFMWVYFGTDLRRIESFQCV